MNIGLYFTNCKELKKSCGHFLFFMIDYTTIKYLGRGAILMLSYCKKCGRTLFDIFERKTKCDVCGSTTYEVPREYIDNFRWRDGDGKQALIEELVKTSPEFDPDLFEQRDGILAQRTAEYEAAMARGKAILEEKSRAAKCPSCGSSNISKIGVVNRAVSVGIFGLASSKIGKTHKCNSCGTTW